MLPLLSLQAFAQVPQNPNIKAYDTLTFNSNGCYGSCPTYSVMLKPDGKVIFNGIRYTKVKGKFSFMIPVEDFIQIYNQVEPLRAVAKQPPYQCKIERTDAQSFNLSWLTKKGIDTRYGYYTGCLDQDYPKINPLGALAKLHISRYIR